MAPCAARCAGDGPGVALQGRVMSGETDLARLIAGMQPVLQPGTYVFATSADPSPALLSTARMVFREEEGVTLILPVGVAEGAGLSYDFACRMITLKIHSALEAVGFLAAISAVLKDRGIASNTVSAFYHDHLFVSEAHAEAAMQALVALSRAGTSG